MTVKQFYDPRQAEMYLNNSVIRFKGEPVYIHGVGPYEDLNGKLGIIFRRLRNYNRQCPPIDIYHKEIDLSPVPLGFINYQQESSVRIKRTCTSTRIPSRHYKIGLSSRNLYINGIVGEDNPPTMNRDFLTSKELAATIKGEYPQYNNAMKSLNDIEYDGSIAFAREFGIQKIGRNFNLIYSKIPKVVGSCRTSRPILKEDFSFLQEKLDGVVNG